MQDIRLVALDLDGTVFNDKKEITSRTLAAIRNAVAHGQRHPGSIHLDPRCTVCADLQRRQRR